MKAAGVDRVGPTGEKRTFHSLRHTYAKRSLEVGAQITWLSRHLGHSSVQVTTGVYGWTMVVTAVASTVEQAKAQAYARIDRVIIPQARYRLDIGDRVATRDLAGIERLGLFGTS